MKWKKYKIFFSFLRPYLHKELLLFICMVAGTVSSLTSPYALKIIIDTCIPKKDFRQMLLVLSVLLLIYLFRLALGYYSDYLSTWIANKVVNDIKIKLFTNLVHQPYAYFEDNSPGDIIQKVNQEIHKIQHFLTNSILRISNNVFSIVGLSVMLCILDYKLFLLSLAVFPFTIFLNRLWKQKIKILIAKTSEKEGDIFNFYIDRIKNIKLIKNFNTGDMEIKFLSGRLGQLFSLYLKSSSYASLSRNVSTFFIALGPLIVLAYGGTRIMQGVLTIGALVAFIQYMNRVYSPSNDMIFFYIDYVSARVSMERILPLLGDVQTTGTETISKTPIHSLAFQDVCFSYGAHEAVRQLSFSLERGKTYGIVGLSGSGKSTTLKLLCRLYDPAKGKIVLNDSLLLEDISFQNWNEQVSMIHQEPLLFMETLRFNLTYGRHDVTDAEIWEALADTQLHALVLQLPQQLDTILGDGHTGVNLSGGQQQQVAIARALLKGGQVIILDEATSAIDSYKEKYILQNIAQRYKDKIVISISHRLSTVCDLDEIIVLQDGRITERGPHAALMAQQGHYHLLFKNQLLHTNTAIA